MAGRALRTVGAAAALAGVLADTACFQEGKEYVDPAVLDAMPNGAFVQEAYLCQQRCKEQAVTVGCKNFVWKASAPATSLRGALGPGGCWLLGSSAPLVDVNATSHPGRVVSGPADCSSNSTATSTNASTAGISLPTLPPVTVPTLAPVALPTVAPSEMPMQHAGNVTENAMNTTGAAAIKEGSGGISPWLIVVATVAIVGVGLGVCFTQFSGVSSKAVKKKKKDKKKKTRATELAPDPELPPQAPDRESLLAATPEPAPASAGVPLPLQAPSLQMPSLEARQPVSFMQPQGQYAMGQMAAPGYAAMGMPSMVYTGQPQFPGTVFR